MDVTQFFLTTALIMVGLVSVIVFFVIVYQRRLYRFKIEQKEREIAYQAQLFDASIESQEQERTRIAKDLHDDIGSMLSTLAMGVNLLDYKGKDLPLVREYSENTRPMLDTLITNLRQISYDLLPPVIGTFGLVAGLHELVDRMNAVSDSLEIRLQVEGQPMRLDSRTALGLYRIHQELLHNTIKHAQARTATIRLTIDGPRYESHFSDDGIGFDVEALQGDLSRTGLGLRSMRSRAERIGAQFRFQSHPGRGSQAQITWAPSISAESA